MKKKRRHITLFLLALMLTGVVGIHFLPDSILFSKKGKKNGLSTISAVFNFFDAPIESENELNVIRLIKYRPGVSTEGRFRSSDWMSNCDIVIFPQIEQPYFELKFPKDTLYKLQRKVKLFPFQKGYTAPLLVNMLIEKGNLIGSRNNLFLLNYEENKHPYYIRETYSTDLIEKQQVSNGVHFKINKKGKDYKKGYDLEFIKTDKDIVSAFIKTKINNLNEMIAKNQFHKLEEFVDLAYLSRYFIFSHLTGRTEWEDTRWIYRLTDGKIYPIATGKNTIKKIVKIKKKSIWDFVLQSIAFKKELLSHSDLSSFFLKKEEIDSIHRHYIPVLSQFKKNLNISQRELNYRLKLQGKTIKENQIFLKNFHAKHRKKTLASNTNNIIELSNFNKQLIESIGFKKIGNTIIAEKGNYRINKNLIFPRGINLVLKAGSVIELNDSVSLLVHGRIQIDGNKDEKVHIQSVGEKPFGVFASIGNNRDTSRINYLILRNGSEAFIDGKYITGALSLYHQNVVLINSSVMGSHADDGLNIKYANVKILDCIFSNNWADQVDLDFCTGSITNCHFNALGGDSNGDGLDVSGCDMNISLTDFLGFNDKGMSVGEKSKIHVSLCNFEKNKNAISVKDESIAEVLSTQFIENEVVFNVYVKKTIFGGAKLYLGVNEFIRNDTIEKKDKSSIIVGI